MPMNAMIFYKLSKLSGCPFSFMVPGADVASSEIKISVFSNSLLFTTRLLDIYSHLISSHLILIN